MAARSVDGPDGMYLSTREAAAWLGVDGRTLRRVAAATTWCRVVRVRGRSLWHWMDVVCLGHVLLREREHGGEIHPGQEGSGRVRKGQGDTK